MIAQKISVPLVLGSWPWTSQPAAKSTRLASAISAARTAATVTASGRWPGASGSSLWRSASVRSRERA